MKAAVTAVLSLSLASTALAQIGEPPDSGARRSLTPESGYHVAYTRRGCRVEEKWDGVRYSAWVTCAPGVRPN
jgi:hypothetical protein